MDIHYSFDSFVVVHFVQVRFRQVRPFNNLDEKFNCGSMKMMLSKHVHINYL